MALLYKSNESKNVMLGLVAPGRITMYWVSLKPEQKKQVTDLGWTEADVRKLEQENGAVIQLKLDGSVCGMKTAKGGRFLHLISKEQPS